MFLFYFELQLLDPSHGQIWTTAQADGQTSKSWLAESFKKVASQNAERRCALLTARTVEKRDMCSWRALCATIQ
jgi:hypothetical protein